MRQEADGHARLELIVRKPTTSLEFRTPKRMCPADVAWTEPPNTHVNTAFLEEYALL